MKGENMDLSMKNSLFIIIGIICTGAGIVFRVFADKGVMGTILIIAGIAAFLYAQWGIAEAFAEIARAKGYYEECMQIFVFFSSLAGYLYVISLPDRTQKQEKSQFNENSKL